MPMFLFQGRNPEGELITGKRLAQTIDALAEQLVKEGVTPLHINPVDTKINIWKQISDKLPGKKVSTEQLSIFARQMHTLYSSGVSLTVSLRQLAQTTHNLSLSDALFGLVESLESGKDLATAMQSYPDVFTPLIISMVRIGQNSGRLDEAFLDLHHYLELETSSAKQVKTILRYPIIVVTALFFATIIITVYVIPTFSQVFAQANIQLPAITKALVSVSNFLLHNWIYSTAICILVIGGTIYYLKTPNGKYKWDRLQLKLPLVGSILRRIILLRFAQSFAVIVKSGIPLVDGLGLVSQSIQNTYAQRQIQHMQTEIQNGKTLTQAAVFVTLFTPLELQMLSVSEETGELSSMLEHLASFYRREVDYSLKKLGDFIEPVLIFGIALLVLGLALAVYLPIWNMVRLVHS
jgi:MSHA biogenesis protein MshG